MKYYSMSPLGIVYNDFDKLGPAKVDAQRLADKFQQIVNVRNDNGTLLYRARPSAASVIALRRKQGRGPNGIFGSGLHG